MINRKMRRNTFCAGVVVGIVGGLSALWAAARLAYPPARVEPVSETRFGTALQDPYRWLENKDDPAVQAWVRAEDQLARETLNKFPRRAALTKRLRELYDADQISLPDKEGPRLFYTHRKVHQEKAAVYWHGEDQREHLLLDPNALASRENVSLGNFYPSPDGTQFAYALKRHNADEAVLRVLDVNSGREDTGATLPWADYADFAWTPDSHGFYYTHLSTDSKIPEADRVAYADVRYHALGPDVRQDRVVYPNTGDASVYLTPHVSRDGRWLFVTRAHGWTGSEIVYRDLRGETPFKPLFVSTCATASVTAWKGTFYLTTNLNAPHQKIMAGDLSVHNALRWKTLVPERPDVIIESAHVLGDHLVLRVLRDVSSRIEIWSLNGALLHDVALPEVGRVGDLSGREDDDTAFYQFESFFIPPRIYRLSVGSGTGSLWSKMNVPLNPALFKVDPAWFQSKDGTPVSMFIVRRKNSLRDNTTPFQILGYGGFAEALTPRFNAAIVPWLEAGGGVAVPHLRGGGEYGEAWHRAGMLTQKQNTFDDFIAAAEYLIQNGYTQKSLLAMQGASNGGLLVGAVLTQRPDLFRAVVCKNPLLDMIRYPLFGEGKAWMPEYGSPDNAQEFRTIADYSPYHHVRKGTRYPSVLLLSAENDDRVDPMHARKMAAALQAASASEHPILLRTLANSGHSGADRVQSQVEEHTDRLSFLHEEVGRTNFTFSVGLLGSWPGVGN